MRDIQDINASSRWKPDEREWRELDEFPNYAVSNLGEFVNMRTDRMVRPSRNQLGHAKITLVADGRQYTRSVANLVAEAFLEKPEEQYDTPIHLDGDLMNCRADNLMWRPRWFAIKYHKQFMHEDFHIDRAERIDVETGEVYNTMKELCMANGLYHFDVTRSCIENTFVPITYQKFQHNF